MNAVASTITAAQGGMICRFDPEISSVAFGDTRRADGRWRVSLLTSSILALDLGREYMRHRRAVNLEEGAEAAEWLIRERDKSVDTSDTEDGKLRRELAELQHRIHYGLMRGAEIASDTSGKVAALEARR